MSETLYLKWRPMTFKDVVGQDHITSILKNQSQSDSFSHAYLFCGSRGTGKTTCARILAKAVNCLHKHNGDPCGVCEVCRGIENGSLLDVIELDAASNNRIDDIRDLKDASVYNPTECLKRIYIVDEVHMLSTSAFNGFLKLLEEPPEHVIFILATTDVQKLPATILSRCQRFDFRRINENDIFGRVKYVAEQEKINITEPGIKKIAAMADGALRNALSMLEQLSHIDGELDEEAISRLLGFADASKLLSIVDAVNDSNTGEALNIFNGLYFSGVGSAILIEELLMLFRDMTIIKTGAKAELLGSGYVRDTVKPYSTSFGLDRLLYIIQTLTETLQSMKNSVHAEIDAELCLIKLCNPVGRGANALAARVEQLEKRLANMELSPVSRQEAEAPPRLSAAPEPAAAKIVQAKAVPEAAVEAPRSPAPKPSPSSSGKFTPYADRPVFMKALKRALGILAYTQLQITPLSTDGMLLKISCESDLQLSEFNKAETMKKLEDAAEIASGKRLNVIIEDLRNKKEETHDNFEELLNFGNEHSDIVKIFD